MLRLPRLPRKETRNCGGANLTEGPVPADRQASEVFSTRVQESCAGSKPHHRRLGTKCLASSEEWTRLAVAANPGFPLRELARERFELKGEIRGKTGNERL